MEQDSEEQTLAQAPEDSGGAVDRDTHRGFVREMNKGFASVYGYGGASVIVIMGLLLAGAAKFGLLASPLLWIAAVIVFLVALFILRIFVRRRAQRMYDRIGQYCAVNDVSVETFKDRYSGEGLYPYFESIFEVVERREKLRNQLRDSK